MDTQESDAGRIAMSVDDAAKKVGLGRATMWQLISTGAGPKTLTVGRRRLIRLAALDEWLQEREAAEGSVDGAL